MTYDPNLSFDTDTSDLSPGQAHDRWEDLTNLQADDLRGLKQGKRYDRYLDNSGGGKERDDGPIPGGPLDDAIHLASTPRDEWGADEKAEAREAINYAKRTVPQFGADEGDAILPDKEPDIHRGEMALATWGLDMAPDDSWP